MILSTATVFWSSAPGSTPAVPAARALASTLLLAGCRPQPRRSYACTGAEDCRRGYPPRWPPRRGPAYRPTPPCARRFPIYLLAPFEARFADTLALPRVLNLGARSRRRRSPVSPAGSGGLDSRRHGSHRGGPRAG